MARYKITCNNPKWVDVEYNGLNFKAVAYTEDDELASEYMHNTLTNGGGEPLFEVEEVEELADDSAE